MSYLLVGDPHLSDRPRDAYRFALFDQVRVWQDTHKPQATFLLGDLTHEKDRHSATLVNKTVEGVLKLKPPVFILKGNHDYIDPENPFFKFLNRLDDVSFIMEPQRVLDGIALVPHIRDEGEFAAACRQFKPCNVLLLHNTIAGAIAETGAPLTGFSASPIEYLRPKLGCFAGDVHRPQQAGLVTYVGAPFHVRFGDDFEPRCLLVHENGRHTNLYFEAPRKWQLSVNDNDEILNNKNLRKGDHVKVTVELVREESGEWPTYRQKVLAACQEIGLEVFGLNLKVNTTARRNESKPTSHTTEDVLTAFCKYEKVPQTVKDVGLELSV